mmetsp:Transcript_116895/g.327045  ORF Transcript_116895/g.327045 Transcript_116895/m.327045 type:complete len:261 (+) Transcript_116895:1168-1950(+)
MVRIQSIWPAPSSDDQGVSHLAIRVERVLVCDAHRSCSVGSASSRHHDHHRHQDTHRAREVPLDRQQRLPLAGRARHCQLKGVTHLEFELLEVEVLAHSVGQWCHDQVDDEGDDHIPRRPRDDAAQVEVRPGHVRPRLVEHLVYVRVPVDKAILQGGLHAVDAVLFKIVDGRLFDLRRSQEGHHCEQGRDERELHQDACQDHAASCDAESVKWARQAQHCRPRYHQHATGNHDDPPALRDDGEDRGLHVLAGLPLLGITS